MTLVPPKKVGDTDPTIPQAKGYLRRFRYGRELDNSPIYTDLFGAALRGFAIARNAEIDRGVTRGPKVNTEGIYDAAMKVQLEIVQRGAPPALPLIAHRKIYFYSAPGSGADFYIGPSWEVGEFARNVLNINHFPLRFPKDDETLLPLFYEWFVHAETELPFVGFSASIIIPALTSYLGVAGIFVAPAIAGLAGLSLDFAGMVVHSYGGQSADPEKVAWLKANQLISPQGVARVFKTLAALPGIQTHGEYHLPKAEFGGRTGMQVGCDILAAFRR